MVSFHYCGRCYLTIIFLSWNSVQVLYSIFIWNHEIRSSLKNQYSNNSLACKSCDKLWIREGDIYQSLLSEPHVQAPWGAVFVFWGKAFWAQRLEIIGTSLNTKFVTIIPLYNNIRRSVSHITRRYISGTLILFQFIINHIWHFYSIFSFKISFAFLTP